MATNEKIKIEVLPPIMQRHFGSPLEAEIIDDVESEARDPYNCECGARTVNKNGVYVCPVCNLENTEAAKMDLILKYRV